ncbi:MAG: sugar phosphate isomerase/epimerase [Candidatus Hydrogenedentes bacterium]|nr:sugar phosphate isomerase/epimerase [Candidatus Hydrogenedentota bacterium]
MKGSMIGRRDFLRHAAMAAAVASTMGSITATAAEGGALKKALQIGMLPKALSDADKFKLAKACGFEGIEGAPMDDLDAAKKLGELAKAAGTPIHSICHGGWDAPMSEANPDVIAKGTAKIETTLRAAKAMGAEVVLLVPAVVNDQVSYDAAYERSQANIKKILPLAEELKVIIAVENVWNKFLLSPLEFARYVDEFQNPWLRAYFDVGNVVVYGWPEQWIRILGKRIARVPLKDFKRDGMQWKHLREGDVNWPAVRKAFADIGYTSYVTPELAGGDEKYLKDLSERIDKIEAGQ